MSGELSGVDPEDILNDMDYYGRWEFENEMMDFLGVQGQRLAGEGQGQGQEQRESELENEGALNALIETDTTFDWSMLKDNMQPEMEQQEAEKEELQVQQLLELDGEEEEGEQEEEHEEEHVEEQEHEEEHKEEQEHEEEHKEEQEEVDQEQALELQYFEQQLAQLDGEPEVAKSPESSVIKPMDWNLLRSLSSTSSIFVYRLCFGQHLNNEYQIYEPYHNMGYLYLGIPLQLPQSRMQLQRQQLTEQHFHLYAYDQLPEHVKYSIRLSSGRELPDLMYAADGSRCTNDVTIQCVARRERIKVILKSTIGACEASEMHSGFNVFGEATRLSLIIHNTELLLDNAMLKELVEQPQTDIFVVVNSNTIYILNGEILLEYTELSNYLLPIKNINLIAYSPHQFAA